MTGITSAISHVLDWERIELILKDLFKCFIWQRFADAGGQDGQFDSRYTGEEMMFKMIEHIVKELVLPSIAQGAGEVLLITIMVDCPYGEEAREQLTRGHDQHMVLEERDMKFESDCNERNNGRQFQQNDGQVC